MQERGSLKKQEGSALVGVVAFSIIMTLAASGLLMVTGSGVNDEVEAQANEQALRSAESGLLIATRYLRKADNWEPANGQTIFSALDIGGISVTATVKILGSDIWIVSDAAGPGLPYTKRVRWKARNKLAGGGTFINNLFTTARHIAGGGYFDNVVIDGPLHSNQPIIISSVNNRMRFVNGQVSNHNMLGKFDFNWIASDKRMDYVPGVSEAWADYSPGTINDYEHGIYLHGEDPSVPTGEELDVIMTEKYNHSQDSLYVGHYYTADAVLDTSTPDPANTDDQAYAYRPTLVFNPDGSADYYSWKKAGGNWVPVHTALGAGALNGKLLRIPNSDLNVLGSVNGQISVMTDPGHSIFVVDDIVYNGFNPAAFGGWNADPHNNLAGGWDNSGNYGIGNAAANSNILGLISGGDLYFADSWRDPRDGNNAAPKTVDNAVMYVMANFVAAQPGGTQMWRRKANGNLDYNAYPNNYGMRFIGGRTIDAWFNYTSGGSQIFNFAKFYHDTRISNGLNAPNMPEIYAADNVDDNLLKLQLSEWTEENI